MSQDPEGSSTHSGVGVTDRRPWSWFRFPSAPHGAMSSDAPTVISSLVARIGLDQHFSECEGLQGILRRY